ncbi:replication protein A 70 kDa DNA-binding subunit E [Trifolium repens]|nr:replication protein A 70 kDa DNA-binding subunit E [Trifolium repens]
MSLSVANGSEFSNISEINSDKAAWDVKAKIIRLWQVSDFNRNTIPFSIEMVLLDSHGDRIHATMNFQFNTFVQRLFNFDIPKSPFHFVPISEIVGGSYDTDYLCDVIGVLTGVGQEREVTNQNGSTTKLNVIALEADGCAESVAFKSSLAENVDTPSPMALIQNGCESRVDLIDEFLHNTRRITLQCLRDAGSEGYHVVAATIKKVLNPDSFWYTACVCNKAVRVMDNTDSAIFVIFDKDASSLFDLSCADMVQALETGARAGVVPALFEALVDKTWLFKVESKANHNQRFEQSFRVRKLCTDAAIIQQFKEKWDNEEAAVGKAINECGSLSTLVGKGKDMLVGGSSNVMNEECEILSSSDVKGKGVFVEATQVGEYTQDLMNKFADAVVDLGDDSSPLIGSTNSVSTLSEKTPVSAKSDEGATLPTVKGLRKKSVAKRVSPKNDEGGEDDNAPIKLLKRPIKIEKM